MIAAGAIEVLRPRHLKDALIMLRAAAAEGRPLVPMAGGTDLFVTLNAGQKPAARYLDLWRLDKLRGVDGAGKRGLSFGGLATFTDCIESRAVQKRLSARMLNGNSAIRAVNVRRLWRRSHWSRSAAARSTSPYRDR